MIANSTGPVVTTKSLGDNPEWMRWNNFGIALLDQEQYAQAIDDFRQVLKLRPDYTDAYTNLAMVYLEWEKYKMRI